MRIYKSSYAFLFFIGLSIVLRFFSFFPSVLDHDESTYMVIGRDILQGKVLYTDVTDNKPIGIFIIYAILHWLFGYSIYLKRLFVALLVGVSASLIRHISKKIFQDNRVAFWSGTIYILFSSLRIYYGLSPNTEIFFNFFTICGLHFLIKKNNLALFVSGLLFGIGFMIKYVVLFDFLAICSFFFILQIIQNRKLTWQIISPFLFAALGFLILFLSINLYFWFGNNFSDFYSAMYIIPKSYAVNPSFDKFIKMLIDFAIWFAPFHVLIAYVLLARNKVLENWHKAFFIVWIAAVLLAIYLPGKGFNHYTIQLMVPFSLIAGLFFHPQIKEQKFVKFILSKKIGVIIGITFVVGLEVASLGKNVLRKDRYKEVANYINQELEPGEQIYPSNFGQIMYYLTRSDAPTKYIHRSILSSDLHEIYGIDPNVEIKKIIDKEPKYVIVKNEFEIVENLIREDYFLDKSFHHDKIHLYKRK